MVSLSTLTDAELLRHASVDFDPLTGTALEAELMRRFEENAAISAENEPMLKTLENYGINSESQLEQVFSQAKVIDEIPNAEALLDVLSEFDIDEPAVLKKQLERIAKFDQAMQDLAEPLATLQTLATTE